MDKLSCRAQRLQSFPGIREDVEYKRRDHQVEVTFRVRREPEYRIGIITCRREPTLPIVFNIDAVPTPMIQNVTNSQLGHQISDDPPRNRRLPSPGHCRLVRAPTPT